MSTGDLEEAAESAPLLPIRQISARAIRSRKSLRADLSKQPWMKVKTILHADALERLQDADYVQDHFSKLDPDEVARAASILRSLTEDGGSPTSPKSAESGTPRENIAGREEFRKAMMFKRRPMEAVTILHFAIWFVAEHGADPEIIEDVLRNLSDPDDALWPAHCHFSRVDGVPTDAYVSAVHIAASLGQVSILKMLLKHATEKTSPAKRMTKDAFVCEWAKLLPEGSTGENYLDNTQVDPKHLHYQPIHDSTYAGNGEVTLWLLRNAADPCARNNKDITPLHFVAFSGLKGGLGTSLGDDLAKIVRSLQRTGQAVGAKADMHLFIPGCRNVTPLEVAVQDASRFPQDHLGLLAPCLASSSTNLSYFDDVKQIAEVTPEGALNLVRNIAEKGKESNNILQRFRICAQMEGKSDQFASIFYMAPLAAGEMLDLLEIEPMIEDPAHHSIPTKTSLWGFFQNIPMRCTYQHDVVKQEGLMVPSWDNQEKIKDSQQRTGAKFLSKRNEEEVSHHGHSPWHDQFTPKVKKAARNSYIKRVRVVASLLPGILDIDVFMAFAQCQHEHLSIMSKKTVQGAITCLWGNDIEHVWAVRGIFLFVDMVAYVTVAGLIQSDTHAGSLCWPIIAAGNFNCLSLVVSHNISLVQKWSQHASDSTMSAMWSPLSRWNLGYSVPMLLQAALGTCFVVDMYVNNSSEGHAEERSHWDDVLLAACLLISCFRFIWMWRLSVIGSRIYSITQTFLAGAVNQVLFITFLLLFSFICALMVLSRQHTATLAVMAYRGFLFGDGDGFNSVGMHMSDHDSPSMPTTSGALIGFAVFGSFFFNVIVLNIIIAIYGNEYDRVQPETPGLFMQGRADYCVKAVLSTYVISWRGVFVNELLIVGALISIVAGMVGGRFGIGIFMSASLLCLGQTLLPMALIQCSWFSPEGQDADDRLRYLWMCHPRDWQWRTDGDAKLALTEDVGEEDNDADEKMDMLDEKVDALGAQMEQILRALRAQKNPELGKRKGVAEEIDVTLSQGTGTSSRRSSLPVL